MRALLALLALPLLGTIYVPPADRCDTQLSAVVANLTETTNPTFVSFNQHDATTAESLNSTTESAVDNFRVPAQRGHLARLRCWVAADPDPGDWDCNIRVNAADTGLTCNIATGETSCGTATEDNSQNQTVTVGDRINGELQPNSSAVAAGETIVSVCLNWGQG